MTVMHTFFDGVREMRAATIAILFEDAIPIYPIGVIAPNCFCHSNGTHKQINRVREHIQADAMVEITMRMSLAYMSRPDQVQRVGPFSRAGNSPMHQILFHTTCFYMGSSDPSSLSRTRQDKSTVNTGVG